MSTREKLEAAIRADYRAQCCDNTYATSGRWDAQRKIIDQLRKELANEQAKETTRD